MLKNSILIIVILLSSIFIFAIQPCESIVHKLDLKKSYEVYKKDYATQEGRVVDPSAGNFTTSEGQSYMLVMSLAMNDRKTFDLIYNWTKNNLRRQDGLFAWRWGKNKDGKYEIIDNNSASDADMDIAFCLVLAYEKWKDEKYLKDAIHIIRTIWNKETKYVDGHRVLIPGAAQNHSEIIEINPSYFSPYEFRIFQKYDKGHDWNELIDSSYYYLDKVTSMTKTGLPPNWFSIKNGQIIIEDNKRGDFSYDAIRVFLRIYFDYAKTGEKRALPILAKTKFFIDKWKKTKIMYINYKADGQLRDTNEFIGAIAILIPPMELFDKKVAAEIYEAKVTPYFTEKGYYSNKNDYYGRNLLWFGEYVYTVKSLSIWMKTIFNPLIIK